MRINYQLYNWSYVLRKGNLNLLKKQNAAQLTVTEKNTVKLLHYHTYAMRAYFKKYPVSPQFPPPPSQKSRIPTIFFNLNIPYPNRFSAFWLRLVSRRRATVKYHCTTYGTFFSAIRGRHRTASDVCSLEKRSLGFFGFVLDSFLYSSSVESWRTFVLSENYLLLVAFVEFWIDDRESFGDCIPDWTTGFKLFS